jgi:hypothetical protein
MFWGRPMGQFIGIALLCCKSLLKCGVFVFYLEKGGAWPKNCFDKSRRGSAVEKLISNLCAFNCEKGAASKILKEKVGNFLQGNAIE